MRREHDRKLLVKCQNSYKSLMEILYKNGFSGILQNILMPLKLPPIKFTPSFKK